jgi:peroxiredoxin
MPAFVLPDPEGNPVRSEDLRGKVVVVRFWASW